MSRSKKPELQIPNQFQLGGQVIKVDVIAGTEHEKAGEWLPQENLIRLYPKGRNYDFMLATFYHELTHAILDVWCRPKASSNENMVDSLGQGLVQFHKTAKYSA